MEMPVYAVSKRRKLSYIKSRSSWTIENRVRRKLRGVYTLWAINNFPHLFCCALSIVSHRRNQAISYTATSTATFQLRTIRTTSRFPLTRSSMETERRPHNHRSEPEEKLCVCVCFGVCCHHTFIIHRARSHQAVITITTSTGNKEQCRVYIVSRMTTQSRCKQQQSVLESRRERTV